MAAKNMGFDKEQLSEEFPRVAEMTFDSQWKLITTFHSWTGGKLISFTKGAIESISDRAHTVVFDEGARALDIRELDAVNDRMAADELRVLADAAREWDSLPDDLSPENIEAELTVIGLVGLMAVAMAVLSERDSIFKTVPLSLVELGATFSLSALTLLAVEAGKFFGRKPALTR